MIKGFHALLLASVLSGCQLLQTKESIVTNEVSENGVAYTLVNMPGNNRVTVEVAWSSKSWLLDESKNQAVPYIGTRLLLAGGADGYPAGVVGERFADMESEGYLEPAVDYVIGTLHYSPEHQEETMQMANAHLRSPLMDDRWFGRIQSEFADQIKESQSFGEVRGWEAMRWSVFKDQPIREALSIDKPNMISDVTQAEVVEWADLILKRKPAAVVIAGDLDAATASAAIDTLLEGIDAKPLEAEGSIALDFTAKRIVLHVPEAEVSTLSFLGSLPPTKDGYEFEDILLVSALGEGSQSVLFEAVRSQLRASYGYGAGVNAFTRDDRVLVLTGQVEDEKIAEAEKVIRAAYADFRENGPSGNLEERKKPMQGALKEQRNDTGRMAFAALLAKLDEQPPELVLALEELLGAVTEQTMQQRLASAFPLADDFIVIVSSPNAEVLPGACVITKPEQAVDC